MKPVPTVVLPFLSVSTLTPQEDGSHCCPNHLLLHSGEPHRHVSDDHNHLQQPLPPAATTTTTTMAINQTPSHSTTPPVHVVTDSHQSRQQIDVAPTAAAPVNEPSCRHPTCL
ncbi:hypothetical protein FXO38_31692 [Capsicum annuum]|nr:hypothetical protein FXO37_36018 [Capsicum annuum]KAF3621732.1 hypothetical protein FXO38_31692 [Capsicum annuum]